MPKEDSTAVIDKLSLGPSIPVSYATFKQYVMGFGWCETETHVMKADGSIIQQDYWEGRNDGAPEMYDFFEGKMVSSLHGTINNAPYVFYCEDIASYDEVTGKVYGHRGEYFRILSVNDTEMRVIKQGGTEPSENGIGKTVYLYVVLRVMTDEQLKNFRESYQLVGFLDNSTMDNPLPSSTNIYEGEWHMYGHIIGYSELMVSDSKMEFLLPEDSLLSRIRDVSNWAEPDSLLARYPDEPFYGSANHACGFVVQHVNLSQQGSSDAYKYVSLNNSTASSTVYLLGNIDTERLGYEESAFPDTAPKPDSRSFFFGFTIGDTPYRLDLIGENGAVAMHDTSTDQWTIMLPTESQTVYNLKTGEMIYNWNWPWGDGSTLYYISTSKKRK
ncbi:MAG: hypothetical protein IJ067_10050 [Prevotella sp.]|nr:hypothetical protein [Prevotella sp.]